MRILVVEDEHLVAKRLVRFLEEVIIHDSDIQLEKSLHSANSYLKKHEIDLLFLDLNLDGADGFDVLRSYLDKSFETVVVSAYTDKAIQAFEFGVLDFIPKPFTIERIEKTISRYLDSKNQENRKQIKNLRVRKNDQILFIPLDDISHIEADSIYSKIYTVKGEKYLYDKPLKNFLQIAPSNFKRIHRSFAVDITLIDALVRIRQNHYGVKLQSGIEIPISRRRKDEIMEMISIG